VKEANGVYGGGAAVNGVLGGGSEEEAEGAAEA